MRAGRRLEIRGRSFTGALMQCRLSTAARLFARRTPRQHSPDHRQCPGSVCLPANNHGSRAKYHSTNTRTGQAQAIQVSAARSAGACSTVCDDAGPQSAHERHPALPAVPSRKTKQHTAQHRRVPPTAQPLPPQRQAASGEAAPNIRQERQGCGAHCTCTTEQEGADHRPAVPPLLPPCCRRPSRWCATPTCAAHAP
jgi:hypothetical protein